MSCLLSHARSARGLPAGSLHTWLVVAELRILELKMRHLERKAFLACSRGCSLNESEKFARILRRLEIRFVHWARHSAVAASIGVVVVGRRGHALAVGLT